MFALTAYNHTRGALMITSRRAKQEEADLGEVEHFALKALAKKAVVDRGQLAHVKDEKLLLQNMAHPLILGLFSTFQVRAREQF